MILAVSLLLVAYLPGALLFRLPVADRPRRAALAAEERAFWAIVLSAVLSSASGLGLAAMGAFSFRRLLIANAIVCLACLLAGRGRLRYGREAGRPGLTALVPLAIIAAGAWLYFPTAEYIMGGRDPGTYMNEGIQIAQRGALITRDALVASVPPPSRTLFFPPRHEPGYDSLRFMGFYVLHPETGEVLGQFPHLYPVWIAIGYGAYGLTGARHIIALWALLGLVTVYFTASRLIGRLAASAACALLTVHVVQVWFARYPNSEMPMQALTFAALLAYARAHQDRDRFFAPVAGVLLGLLPFVRIDAGIVIGGAALAGWLTWLRGQRPLVWFLIPLGGGLVLAAAYLLITMAPYISGPLGMLGYLGPFQLASLGAAFLLVVGLSALARRRSLDAPITRWAPFTLSVVVLAAAAYAYFFRRAGGSTAAHDADALRTYAAFYLSPYGLAAALLGFVLVIRRSFWRDPALLLTTAAAALFVFYKVRIVPEHFWMARRFVPVILPMSLVLIAAAAFSRVEGRSRAEAWLPRRFGSPWVSGAIGLAFLVLLGSRYLDATAQIRQHVEYAGLIPRLETLAGRFDDRDLVIIEARNASDLHVFALPLAYIYARQVLVLDSPRPDKVAFAEFLTWARARYREVFFIGGGGTDLLSRSVAVAPVDSDRFQVPEYESSRDRYPRQVRHKEWDFGIYRFIMPRGEPAWFSLDVGMMDDLLVVRFHAKERHRDQRTFRWTRDESYVSLLVNQPDARLLTVWMSNGGRPAAAGPARVDLAVNDRPIGGVTVGAGFAPYTFMLPPDLAQALAVSPTPGSLRILTPTWSPREYLGVPDDRQLGVMVDRIELR